MSVYIFDILFITLDDVCVMIFMGLSALVCYWSSVFMSMIIYKFLNVCPFYYTAFVVSGKFGIPYTGFNHTNWVAVVTSTDRPKSVRNRYIIEIFGGVFCCHFTFFEFSVGVKAFVI